MSALHCMKRFGALVLLPLAALAQDAAPVAATEPAKAKPMPAEIAPYAVNGLLLDVVNTGGDQLVAVGERGDILLSGDGEQWTQVPVPVRATLTAVSFADPQHGWAVGHDAAIVHSADGGKTWALQHFDPELHQPLLDVLFVDAQRGYALGSFGLFLVTSDGGKTWAELEAPSIREEGLHFNGIVKLGNGEVLVVGETGMLGVSRDGVAWDRLTSPYEGTFFGAAPLGEKGAVIFGLRGNAYMSDDVRANPWKKIETGTTLGLYGGTPMPGGDTAIVGADGLVLVIAADGSVKARMAKPPGAFGGGSLSSAVPWKGGLLSVGELGIERRGVTQKP